MRSLLAVCKEDPLSAVLLVCWALSLGFAVGGICAAKPIAASLWPVQGAAAPGGEVIRMQRTALAVLALCASCAADPTAPAGLLPPGHRPPVAVPLDDGGALVDLAPVVVDSAPAVAPDAAPPADLPPAFPSCAAIGYRDVLSTCEDRRTGDQRYSCGTCGAVAPSQPCESAAPHPGDIPWLCVRSCAECAAVVKCTGTNVCTVVRYDDGGVL